MYFSVGKLERIQHTSLQTTQFNGKKEKFKKWTYKKNYITW